MLPGVDDSPYMTVDDFNYANIDVIKKLEGHCLVLIIPSYEKVIESASQIAKAFPLSILVPQPSSEYQKVGKPGVTHDTVIIPSERHRPLLLLCPDGKAKRIDGLLTNDIEQWTCKRRLDGQSLLVNYIDFIPYMIPSDKPESPDGIAIEGLRILAMRRNVEITFQYSNHLAFDEESGTWYLGCVSIMFCKQKAQLYFLMQNSFFFEIAVCFKK